MKSYPAVTKAEMIERSMSCFVLGLLGLLPIIGVPMAVRALGQYRRVKGGQGDQWNPARRYLVWGSVCARLGLTVLLLVTLAIIAIVLIESTHFLDGVF